MKGPWRWKALRVEVVALFSQGAVSRPWQLSSAWSFAKARDNQDEGGEATGVSEVRSRGAWRKENVRQRSQVARRSGVGE